MNQILVLILIGISLSMDAFSLSLIYGTVLSSNRKKILLAIIVGIYHFIMPIVGLHLGEIILDEIRIGLNIVTFIIFFAIAIDMLITVLKQKEETLTDSIFGLIMFGFTVSIDSFITGVGIRVISNNQILVSFIFFIISMIFTYIGLNLGDRLSRKIGKYAIIFGSFLLLILSFYYLFSL